MTTRPNEVVSNVRSPDELLAAIEGLPAILRALAGETIVSAYYGYGCNLHPDICYLPMKVGTAWIDRFIRDSLQQRIVVPGKSDFSFTIHGGKLEVEFCHDGHIHVSGTDIDLHKRFLEQPPFTALAWSAEKSAHDA